MPFAVVPGVSDAPQASQERMALLGWRAAQPGGIIRCEKCGSAMRLFFWRARLQWVLQCHAAFFADHRDTPFSDRVVTRTMLQ